MSAAAVLSVAAGVLAAAAVAELLATWGDAHRRRRGGGRRDHVPGEHGDDGVHGPRTGSAAPVARAGLRLLAGLGRRFPRRAPAGLARRIDSAGLDATAAELTALKAGAGIAGLALALPLLSGAPGRSGWLVLLGMPLVGFLAPDLWLRRRAHHRRRAMEQQLGDVLELLRVAVEAGLTVPRALREVGRRHHGILAAEIAGAASLMELGVAQQQALERLLRRCPVRGIEALAAALGRAARHGAPLGDALAAQAEEARARRAREAIEVAARAAPKIQLIVALLLVPSAMLLMAAAMLPALAWR